MSPEDRIKELEDALRQIESFNLTALGRPRNWAIAGVVERALKES